MAKLLKLRRGTTTQHGSFTGAEGEVTIDTTKDTAVVHDGSTAGGRPLARQDMNNVPAGTILGTQLENSGVTAAAYGSSSAIPIITVDAQGLVTAASTTAIDSTTIANGSASVAVASNGPITSNANHDFSAGIDVTGNITVSGTVDGVDIATRDTLFGGLTSSSGVIADNVTTNTQSAGNNTTRLATTAFVTTAIANADAFPSGTKMLFQQTAAPTGWTKVTSGVDNKALRVVSGTASSGGSNAFSNTLADRSITANAANTTATGNITVSDTSAGGNVSIDSATTGGTVDSHTLTSNQMPSHEHAIYRSWTGEWYWDSVQGSVPVQAQQGNATNWTEHGGTDHGRQSNHYMSTHPTGGGGGHSHGFTGGSHTHNGTLSGTAHSHNATFTGSAHNHSISVTNLDLAVQYLDVIIASKD